MLVALSDYYRQSFNHIEVVFVHTLLISFLFVLLLLHGDKTENMYKHLAMCDLVYIIVNRVHIFLQISTCIFMNLFCFISDISTLTVLFVSQ